VDFPLPCPSHLVFHVTLPLMKCSSIAVKGEDNGEYRDKGASHSNDLRCKGSDDEWVFVVQVRKGRVCLKFYARESCIEVFNNVPQGSSTLAPGTTTDQCLALKSSETKELTTTKVVQSATGDEDRLQEEDKRKAQMLMVLLSNSE